MPAMFTHIESSLTVVLFHQFQENIQAYAVQSFICSNSKYIWQTSSKASVITIYVFFSHIYYAISLLKTVGTPINTG
jgi:hypothetical protein